MFILTVVFVTLRTLIHHAGASPTTVLLPDDAVEGTVIYASASNGEPIRIQVPQGYYGTNGITSFKNRGLVIPAPTLQEQESLQVHLHHTAAPNSVALSWATPTHANCSPTVVLHGSSSNKVQQDGITRTYPSAILFTNKTAEFQHVVLSHLIEGFNYNYTVTCDGKEFSNVFIAPKSSIPGKAAPVPADAYTFAIFGDMGVSNAAHDTIRSMQSSLPFIEAVFHIGDLSYARSKEDIWNQFFGMIEPIASRVPWTVAPGNHDMRKGDSDGECGLPMLSRFETPRSRTAQPHLLTQNSTLRCNDAYNNSIGNPFWYTVHMGHATIITYSSDSNLTRMSPQWNWLQSELEKANTKEAREEHPWLFLMGHKPMYTASTYSGCISTRDNIHSGEGTEGQLTNELEDLFVKNQVDVSFYGHIHSYNRMFPTKQNGTYVENQNRKVYINPKAPVHMMVGMSGAGHLGAPYDTPSWSAYSEISYGWLRTTFANRSSLHLEFIANGDGLEGTYAPAVHDDVWIIKDF